MIPYKNWTFSIVLFLASFQSRHLCQAAVNLGPIKVWPTRGAFSWQAAVDKASGLATSKETSEVSKRSKLQKTLKKLKDRDLLKFAESLAQPYAAWLSKFTVTMGLLKAKPTNGGYELRDRVFGINFLTIGRASGQRVSFQSLTPEGVRQQTSQCTVAMPITGGLMTREGNGVCGIIQLTLTKNELAYPEDEITCSIQTELIGYRPSLTGPPPVPATRKWFYLCTQSVVHGYVMWRFHRRTWGMSLEDAMKDTVRKDAPKSAK